MTEYGSPAAKVTWQPAVPIPKAVFVIVATHGDPTAELLKVYTVNWSCLPASVSPIELAGSGPMFAVGPPATPASRIIAVSVNVAVDVFGDDVFLNTSPVYSMRASSWVTVIVSSMYDVLSPSLM